MSKDDSNSKANEQVLMTPFHRAKRRRINDNNSIATITETLPQTPFNSTKSASAINSHKSKKKRKRKSAIQIQQVKDAVIARNIKYHSEPYLFTARSKSSKPRMRCNI